MALYKIKWDFKDTEFDELTYSEALEQACLPEEVEFDEQDEDIESYLIEEYLFYPEKVKKISDD